MSWPLASFLVVAVVLVVGWLAYERSRPSARTVALVATLSALAAIGRDAFAAFPEVKPITAMTFVVGYALGPLPGFVVGAIGMLASNMMLGQGPYTPWQMAAWGGVGLLGGLAGSVSRRRLRGRLSLALGCAFAAFFAMLVMDVYEWTMTGIYTWVSFAAKAAPALPFDALDIGSTFVFGLLFAPELARLLARARERMTVCWNTAGASAPLLLIAALGAVALAPAQARAAMSGAASSAGAAAHRGARTPPGSAAALARLDIARGVAYLASAQGRSGGFGAAPGSPDSSMFTSWAALGLGAAGVWPNALARDGRTPLAELAASAHTIEAGAGGAERTMLALRACGAPVDRVGGVDLLARLLASREGGSFEGQVNLTAFALFALRAAGYASSSAVVRAAAAWLEHEQNSDGGFSFGRRGDPSDVDDTAAALEALLAAGVHDGRLVSGAVRYLEGAENPDGGFPQEAGGESNAQSSAWAVQALVAAGAPIGMSGAAGANTPIGYLERSVQADGSVRYSVESAQTPVWVTAEALAAFAAEPFPALTPQRRNAADELAAGAALDGVGSLTASLARTLAFG